MVRGQPESLLRTGMVAQGLGNVRRSGQFVTIRLFDSKMYLPQRSRSSNTYLVFLRLRQVVCKKTGSGLEPGEMQRRPERFLTLTSRVKRHATWNGGGLQTVAQYQPSGSEGSSQKVKGIPQVEAVTRNLFILIVRFKLCCWSVNR
jgi:hypothetical protein